MTVNWIVYSIVKDVSRSLIFKLCCLFFLLRCSLQEALQLSYAFDWATCKRPKCPGLTGEMLARKIAHNMELTWPRGSCIKDSLGHDTLNISWYLRMKGKGEEEGKGCLEQGPAQQKNKGLLWDSQLVGERMQKLRWLWVRLCCLSSGIPYSHQLLTFKFILLWASQSEK